MDKGQATVVNQRQALGELRFCFGRKARNQIRAQSHIGPQATHVLAKLNRITAQVAALHALEDEIRAGL